MRAAEPMSPFASLLLSGRMSPVEGSDKGRVAVAEQVEQAWTDYETMGPWAWTCKSRPLAN